VCARRYLADRDEGWISECADDTRATMSPMLDFKCRTNHAGAVLHDPQSHPVRLRYYSGKTHAVIVYHERETLWQHCERDGDMLCLPMLHRIVDGFLHHTIQVRCHSVISNMER